MKHKQRLIVFFQLIVGCDICRIGSQATYGQSLLSDGESLGHVSRALPSLIPAMPMKKLLVDATGVIRI